MPDADACRQAVHGTLPWGVRVEVAFFGCIHGDADALEAVLGAISAAGISRMRHVGGLLGGDAEGDEQVVRRLIELGVEGVRGCSEENAAWVSALSPAARTYVENLPRELRVELGGLEAHGFHGTPRRLDEHLTRSTRDHFLMKIARRSGARILVYGGSHLAYSREVGDRIFLDVGSVRPPARGSAQARGSSFGVLEFGRQDPAVRLSSIDLPEPDREHGDRSDSDRSSPDRS